MVSGDCGVGYFVSKTECKFYQPAFHAFLPEYIRFRSLVKLTKFALGQIARKVMIIFS